MMSSLDSILKITLPALIVPAIVFLGAVASAETTATVPKGVLSEINSESNSEEQIQQKSFRSEVMITKSENMAIEALKKIIRKKAGTREEADLLYRLGELYMRRAKSGRFFDLDNQSSIRLKQLGLNNQKADDGLKQAVQIYNQILNRFPKFSELDYVLFNNAMAYAQLKDVEKSKKNYLQLISQFRNSPLVPDALLEVGELFYQQKNFQTALQKFKDIENFPESKAYPYGLYKSAWCYYNLKDTDSGIQQLLSVVKQNPADNKDDRKYNLRRESLRDLTLFVGETLQAHQVFSFFEKITTPEELGEIMMALTGLYESHSRYKEISVFADEFIKSYPENAQASKLYTKLIETYETLKQRDTVIKKLASMASFCQDRKLSEPCLNDFRKVSLEISKKWWEIWLNNKGNAEFSTLTEKAFENLLSIDSPTKPDSKSRYAFADLLFQQQKFTQATVQYEIVSKHQNIEKTLSHDSLYGALFSIEKLIEKEEKAALIEKQKELSLRYVTEFKNGEHFNQITFKLGYIAYKQEQYDLALSYLDYLLKNEKAGEIKTKSEDITLDIYNIKKDYVTIQKITKTILKANPAKDREKSLTKILEEAHYSQVQIDAKNLEIEKQIDLLQSFSAEHRNTKLGQDAFWQSISLAYTKSLDVKAAELSLEYVKLYPSDHRKIDALKDAVKAFIDSARLKQAISTLKMLNDLDKNEIAKNSELICDLTLIDGGVLEARRCYQSLFKTSEKTKKVQILSKLLGTFNDKDSSEYKDLQNQILASNIEPYATQILITQARAYLDKNDFKQAFSMSLKINARPVDEDVRAEARLIQARVLESEFVSQSVKAREDKFAMVIAMKTEKLDKSFTAYTSAIKMSKTDKIQIQGLEGIDRLYAHYIQAISNMPLPESLPEAEQKVLKQELVKLTSPFAEKRKSNAEKLTKLSQLSASETAPINWAEHSVEKSIEPQINFPQASQIGHYLPRRLVFDKMPERSPAGQGRCDEKNIEAESLNACISDRKFTAAEKMALQLTSTPVHRVMGLYYLSLIADAEKQFDKSLWLINKAQELNPKFSLLNYQKAKVLYNVEGVNSSFEYFAKVIDMKESSTEIRVITGIKAFSDRDYKRADAEFSRLSVDQTYNYGVDLIHLEAELLNGDHEKALKLAESFSAKSKARIETDFEMARMYESFIFNKDMAISYYNKAAKKTKNADQLNWITKKIEFLKTNNNNQITSYVGGE